MSTSDEVQVLSIKELPEYERLAFLSRYFYDGKTFDILVTNDPPEGYDKENALELEWLNQMLTLGSHDGYDDDIEMENVRLHGDYLHEVALKIKDIALPTLKELAPLQQRPDSLPGITLRSVQEYLYPDVVRLQLVTLHGRFRLIKGHQTKLQDFKRPLTCEELQSVGLDELSLIPIFPASDVFLGDRFLSGSSAFDASVRNTEGECVCKIISEYYRQQILAELSVLVKIQKLHLGPEARVPAVKGLISYGGGFVGFLMDKIPAKFSTLDRVLQRTPDVIDDQVTLARKRKWVAQLEYTISELHIHGLVWGDVQPDNVIIDTDDNAWVIDFGGGYTRPWVEHHLAGSPEGDIQALKKMKAELEVE